MDKTPLILGLIALLLNCWGDINRSKRITALEQRIAALKQQEIRTDTIIRYVVKIDTITREEIK